MKHCMKLQPEPFQKIERGQKSVELRLYDEKRRNISVGDEIEFTCTTDGRTLTKRVIALHIYESFAQLYADLPLGRCGYAADEIAAASPEDMRAYYGVEQEKRYGVVGIELL